ncbi:kinase-like domain, phloem protein 2-like protein [Tanacetum coccineum]
MNKITEEADFGNVYTGQLFLWSGESTKNEARSVEIKMNRGDDENRTTSLDWNFHASTLTAIKFLFQFVWVGSLTSISTHVESHVSKETKSFLKDLSHLKISWKDIVSATNNFAQENILDENGWIFKGRLLHSKQFIDIFGKAYRSDSEKDESKMFWMELSMLLSLKHKNLVSLIGFCDGAEGKAIMYKREANGSLEKYLSDENLTWMQRLKICVGVANALSYIHYDAGRDFSVIHCNIKSSNILLE